MAFPFTSPAATEGFIRPPSHPLSPSSLVDLDITIYAAEDLKNINWRNGDLKPYAVFWLDSDRQVATNCDKQGSINPIWNQSFTLPMKGSFRETVLTLDVFHSDPSETSKPPVGTLRLPFKDLSIPDDLNRMKSFELRRPSGRIQGKIRLKLSIRGNDFPPVPDFSPMSPRLPPLRDYRGYIPSLLFPPLMVPPPPVPYSYRSYSDPFLGFDAEPSLRRPPRPLFDRFCGYGWWSGVSAPLYDQRQKGSNMGGVGGLGAGLAMEGLEALRFEEEKVAERLRNAWAGRDYYGGEHPGYY